MPTWTSIDAYEREFAAFERDAERQAKLAALDAARRGQKIATEEASRDLGGDPKFSGWEPTLDTVVHPKRDGAVLLPTRHSAGPWTVAEYGRNQGTHGGGQVFFGPGINRSTGVTARTKSGGIRKVRAAKSKRWNGMTQGKGTATRAVQRIANEVEPLYERHHLVAIRKHFDST